jgi:hypothetical protein
MDQDSRQELHQRSLRNVRAYLDKEEAELAREKRAPRLLLYAMVPAIVLVAVVAIWGIPGRKGATTDPRLLECQMRTWAEKSGERERELRAQNPGITPSEIGRRLQAENAAIEAAARRQCESGTR